LVFVDLATIGKLPQYSCNIDLQTCIGVPSTTNHCTVVSQGTGT
jgi:hypothetical protein